MPMTCGTKLHLCLQGKTAECSDQLAEATGSVTYSCAVDKRQHTLKMVSDSNSAGLTEHYPNLSYEHYGRLYNMTLLRNPTSTHYVIFKDRHLGKAALRAC